MDYMLHNIHHVPKNWVQHRQQLCTWKQLSLSTYVCRSASMTKHEHQVYSVTGAIVKIKCVKVFTRYSVDKVGQDATYAATWSGGHTDSQRRLFRRQRLHWENSLCMLFALLLLANFASSICHHNPWNVHHADLSTSFGYRVKRQHITGPAWDQEARGCSNVQ